MRLLELCAFTLLLIPCQFCLCSDPRNEENMTPREMILSNGYPEENHWVTTEDGFILAMNRIPYSRHQTATNAPRPVFFLQHGVLCSSTNWITNQEKGSLAFILSDAGFDVWMGNSRGNTYSTNHTHLNRNEPAFWAWSYDEMAKYDLPAMVYYVMNATNQSSIYYVGHSQGTLTAFTGFSINPELASHIKAFFALAPVAKVGHAIGLSRYLAGWKPELKEFFKVFGVKDFLPSNSFMKFVARFFCDAPLVDGVCGNILFLLLGFDEANLNETRLPVYLSHTPAGTSVQNMYHYAQGVNHDKFQMYDYESSETNIAHYNQSTPPQYNLTDFHVPTYAYAGGKDYLADPTDVAWLLGQLSSLKGNTTFPSYDHLDFIWGEDAWKVLYPDIIKKALALEMQI